MAQESSTRVMLVTALLYLAGDEYEGSEDFIKLAKQSEQELIQDLIHAATYYKELNND
jgi:hypothetical protein